jgi:hypothetical protein
LGTQAYSLLTGCGTDSGCCPPQRPPCLCVRLSPVPTPGVSHIKLNVVLFTSTDLSAQHLHTWRDCASTPNPNPTVRVTRFFKMYSLTLPFKGEGGHESKSVSESPCFPAPPPPCPSSHLSGWSTGGWVGGAQKHSVVSFPPPPTHLVCL